MKKNQQKKGQFSIIAALLVAVILVAAVIVTYATIRNLPFREYPETLSSIQEMNLAIKRVLDFAIGYYGSILQVTGSATYARELTSSYLESGFVYIVHSHPEWNPSFEFSYPPSFSIRWFEPTSYSMANISVTYSLSSLGIFDVKYETASILNVTILGTTEDGQARVAVMRGENQPDLTLGVGNFFFYSYSYSELAWSAVPTNRVVIHSNGYNLTIPPGVDETAFSLQVVDSKGVMVTAFFSTSGCPQYTYTFNWNSTGKENVYSNLNSDTMVVEALQNGTLRWLGQNLQNVTRTKPIPPLPVRCLRINVTTVDRESHEVPFQVEDWASNYRIPLGLSTNTTLFSSRNMLVFLVNHSVRNVTLWWDGGDTAKQTPYARYDPNISPFKNDDVVNKKLTNGILTIKIDFSNYTFKVESTVGTSKSTAELMRINNEVAHYGHAEPTYAIHHGIVRDVVQHEVEWDTGARDCPNVYAQIVLTLPANATYYTYALRTIFVNSLQSRTLRDLSLIQLSSEQIPGLRSFTENGTNISTGFPIVAETNWWDSNYQYRKKITVKNNIASTLDAGYSVKLTINTTALVTANKVLPNGDDLRICYWNSTSSTWTELDRDVINMNTTSTEVWWKTQKDIAGDEIDSNYYVYYGYSDASNPPAYWSDSMGTDALSRVYLAADNFEEHSVNDYPDGWTGLEDFIKVVDDSGNRVLDDSTHSGDYALTGDSSWTDIAYRMRARSVDGVVSHMGMAVRVIDANNLLYFGYASSTKVQVWTRLESSYNMLKEWNISDIGTTWHTLEGRIVGQTFRVYHDGTYLGSAPLPSGKLTSGKVGLFCQYSKRGYRDDFIVRKYVCPEPLTTLGSEESKLFYNFSSPTGWAHHWSEFIEGNSGAGIMFTNSSNMKLYIFDIADNKTGALFVNVENGTTRKVTIEFNPVARFEVAFTDPFDIIWYGAVVTFTDQYDPIYPVDGGNTGLWIIVEYPPIISVG